jgi:hypothetical protein
MSFLAATWTSAAATVALTIGASVTAAYAIKAYRKQSEQTRLLQEQASRDIEQRRRAQASHVFACVEMHTFSDDPMAPKPSACIRNTSSQPVYDITLSLGDRADEHWPVLMPGREHVKRGLGTDFASGKRPAWATFRDSAGLQWRAAADGQLTELPANQVTPPGKPNPSPG